MLLGAGMATGIANNPSWSAANDISPGAVLLQALETWGHLESSAALSWP